MNLRIGRTPALAAAILAMSSFATPVSASVVFELSTAFSGAAPMGATPWATATFEDVADGVKLTMEALNLEKGDGSEGEHITAWWFNFDDYLDIDQLGITRVGAYSTAPMENGISKERDNLKADGGPYFDIKFDFPPPPTMDDKKDRFSSGEVAVYMLTYDGTEAFGASSFDVYTGPSDKGAMRTAAKVQGIGYDGGNSGWITEGGETPVPEPFSIGLLGIGLLGLVVVNRRRLATA